MIQWWTKYKPVKNPVEDPRGWKRPYQGDDWPTKDDWYWVWEGQSRILLPRRAYWSSKEQRFFARPNVVAWRKAEVIP